MRKQKIILFVLMVAMLFLLSACSGGKLNADEELAYQNALKMKEMLKNPDSFCLYDKMYLLKKYDKDGNLCETYTVFDYGGTNSFGAMLKSTAIFKDNKYIMDFDDERENDEQTIAWAVVYIYEVGDSVDTTGKIDIDINKIKNKLELN